MKKKPTLYIIILCLWACCVLILGISLTKIILGLEELSSPKKQQLSFY